MTVDAQSHIFPLDAMRPGLMLTGKSTALRVDKVDLVVDSLGAEFRDLRDSSDRFFVTISMKAVLFLCGCFWPANARSFTEN